MYCARQKRIKKMDAVESMIAKPKRKKTFRDLKQKTIDHLKNPSTKMIIDFDCESFVSINSLAVNKPNLVKVTTRFFSGKMLMFDLIEIFYFPNIKTKMIYRSYGIGRILPIHIFADTDGTSLLFHIICEAENLIPDNKFRGIIFEVIVQNDIISRFDTSHEYRERFNVRNKNLEITLGYCEIESIDNPCQVVVVVNPKE